MDPIAQKVKKAGLSEKAAIVYSVLLRSGGAYPSRLAEETHLNRSTVYKVLLDLSIKGLVTEITRGKKLYYQIEKPQKLITYARANLERSKDMLSTAENLLPDLEGLYSLVPNKPKISYYEGREGVVTIYSDHINVEKPYEMVAWANAAHLLQFLPDKFFDNYRREKERLRIITRGILPDTKQDRDFLGITYKHIAKKYWPVMKYIPSDQFPFKAEITVYSDSKVSIVNMENNHLSGVIIEDPTIHQMMRMIFELSWNGLAS